MSELALLAQYVDKHGGSDIVIQSHSSSGLSVFVKTHFPSGRVIEYDLNITLEHGSIVARENHLNKSKLPKCCIQRHINFDGSFCIGWKPDSKNFINVIDLNSAEEWWLHLMAYLRDQYFSGQRREWVSSREWAHGDAAIDQKKALDHADLLGENTKNLVEEGRVSVKKRAKKNHKTILNVYLDDRIWYIVRSDKNDENFKVVCAKQNCFFHHSSSKKNRPLKKCSKDNSSGGHHLNAVMLARHVHEWHRRENEIISMLKNKKMICCGTMDNCPLKQSE